MRFSHISRKRNPIKMPIYFPCYNSNSDDMKADENLQKM